MTDKVFEKFVKQHVGQLLQDYSLNEWKVTVSIEPAENFHTFVDNAQVKASVVVNEPYRSAHIAFNRDFLSEPDKEILKTIEHEVQHIALYPLEAAFDEIEDWIRPWVPPAMMETLGLRFNRATERLRALLGRITGAGD